MFEATLERISKNAETVMASNTDDWVEERRKSVGCSDLSAILGLNPYQDQHGVWLQKTVGASTPSSWRMEIGHALEPVVRGIFTERTNVDVREHGMLRSLERPYFHYSPDGITSDGGVFEAKTTSHWLKGDWADGQTADHAEIQVQGGMYVTGLDHAWVAVMIDANPDSVQVRRVERNDEFIRLMLDSVDFFWREYVEKNVEPPVGSQSLAWLKEQYVEPVEGEQYTFTDDNFDVFTAYREATRAVSEANKRKKEAEALLREQVKDAGVMMYQGEKLGTISKVTRRDLDKKRLQEAGINLDDYMRESSYTRINLNRKVSV